MIPLVLKSYGPSGLAWGAQRWFTSALGTVIRRPGTLMPTSLVTATLQSSVITNGNRLKAFQKFAAARLFDSEVFEARQLLFSDETYDSLWMTEGVGFFAANKAFAGTPRSWLLSDNSLPKQAMLPLHTGMGMAAGLNAFRRAESRGKWNACDIVAQFLGLCNRSAHISYLDAAIESLGLVSCMVLHPNECRLIASELGGHCESGESLFWHGFGRGLYFSPISVCPLLALRSAAMEVATRLPPHEQSRRNCVAGLAWAVTLVNIRHPHVIEKFLNRNAHLVNSDAFANGVTSALTLWQAWAPDSDCSSRIRTHTPVHSPATWFCHATKYCRHTPMPANAELFRYHVKEEVLAGTAV